MALRATKSRILLTLEFWKKLASNLNAEVIFDTLRQFKAMQLGAKTSFLHLLIATLTFSAIED